MCIVCRWSSGKEKLDLDIEELNCSYCTILTAIPLLPKLKYIDCWDCKSLTTIPPLPKLKTLFCEYCTALTSIPVMPELKTLDCRYCTSLTSIPVLPKLEELYCGDCTALTSILVMPKLALNCDGCTWIDHKNADFKQNIETLRTCQAIFRRKLTARKLEKLIPSIIEIYYSPDCKGARIAEKSFLKQIQ
jgi:uncharacterized paraquat-inducible protein A